MVKRLNDRQEHFARLCARRNVAKSVAMGRKAEGRRGTLVGSEFMPSYWLRDSNRRSMAKTYFL